MSLTQSAVDGRLGGAVAVQLLLLCGAALLLLSPPAAALETNLQQVCVVLSPQKIQFSP
jgi:hypothetical protein